MQDNQEYNHRLLHLKFKNKKLQLINLWTNLNFTKKYLQITIKRQRHINNNNKIKKYLKIKNKASRNCKKKIKIRLIKMKKLMKIIEKILFKITKITKMAKINQNKMLKKML